MSITARQAELLYAGLRDLVAKLEEQPQYRIFLPNLRIPYCHIHVLTDLIRIDADVLNDGLAVSRECNLLGRISVVLPTGHIVPQPDVVLRCPALQPGFFSWFRPFHEFPNPGDGHSIIVHLEVDPPTPERPGGDVWESNETDNTASCMVFTTLQTPRDPPDSPDSPSIPHDRPDPSK